MATPLVIKRPTEQFQVGLKYVAPDLDRRNEEIVDVAVRVEPNTPAGVQTVGQAVIDIDKTSIMIFGGEDGQDYYVIFTVTTSSGHVYEDGILVVVREVS